jgi:amino acid adenylation domain-containing protein
MNDTWKTEQVEGTASVGGAAIAIIGMAGRFPGAGTIGELWANLRAGTESITRFLPQELEDSFSDEVRASPEYVPARAILDNVDMFDAEFFGMHAREAALTDPQHRVFLECCWEALEDAGHDPARFTGAIGVFAGSSYNSYLMKHVLHDRRAVDEFTSSFQVGCYQELMGALQDLLATRVAYKLDLKGPAVNVQSACSTSLLAVAEACQSLLLFQSDMALAGGVSITFPQRRGYLAQDGGMVSPDGHCRPFDARAGGTVFGSGAGVVVLKRLDDAIAARDTIHAVVRGFGVNNDGGHKIGFTAPSIEGQAAAIASALAMADVDAASIGFVECHGTATSLGDPVEFKGLERAFQLPSGHQRSCYLGSAKGNFGHLDAAAGVTGLIKATLAVREAEIPPVVNFVSPNLQISLDAGPFAINPELVAWPQKSSPRRAGVSSFGVGGTNVHLVLEEAPRTFPGARRSAPSARLKILPLSARSPDGLKRLASGLADRLATESDVNLRDVAYTLQVGRRAFDHRAAIVPKDRDEAITKLRTLDLAKARPAAVAPKIVFMFPGQGAQYPGMGRALFETDPVFRQWVDRGAQLLEPVIGTDIRKLLYGDIPTTEEAPHAVRSTTLAQPALFVIEYAAAQTLLSRGVEPAAMIGHSLGEFVAACLAGVFTFEDALRLVAARGRLMQAQPAGAMLGVRLPEAELLELCGPGVEIAAINAPSLSVASGPFEGIAELEAKLDAKEITHRRLHTSHAFHSSMMDDVVAALASEARKVKFSPPVRRYVSAVSGTWVDPAQAMSPAYWAAHCRNPVRFSQALETLLQDQDLVLLEVGPGRTLSTFASQATNKAGLRATITTLPEFADRGDELSHFAMALGALWREGAALDWSKIHDPGGRRVSLPTYPFARKRHWIDAPLPVRDAAAMPAPAQTPPPTAAPATLSGVQAQAIGAPMVASARAPGDARAGIDRQIRAMLEELSGETLADAGADTTFLELGFDSLFLGQIVKRLQKAFAVKVSFRQLMREYPSIAALTAFVLKTAKPELLGAAQAPPPIASGLASSSAQLHHPGMTAPVAATPGAGGASLAAIEGQLVAMQQMIAQQLQNLQAIATGAQGAIQPPRSVPGPVSAAPSAAAPPEAGPSRFQMYRPGARSAVEGITPAQQRFIDSLARKWSEKTPGSKKRTQDTRTVLADPRSASGFRAEWKELVYPLVCARSKGSKLWDVDGNEYVDLVNGFGQTMFGHAPDFVVEAVTRQLEAGFAIGPQCALAGEVAQLFSEMTGTERVTFCNTGSEAVMAALRVARTVTGRDKVVVFGGAYHGQFDEVLVRPASSKSAPGALPIAPGIPAESVGNMIVLPYATPESLEWVRANADDLAAVVAETVQSRHPSLLPREFLTELRAITQRSGTALVFDEVVTGFRAHPGGMQTLFGIKADLATYGKVVGGGMPVGVLAGRAEFMDALDGGFWSFGDDSVPEVAPTFFAGTFVRHPLTLAACRAVLLHLKEQGPALQEALNRRATALVDDLNSHLEAHAIATRLEGYSSWCYANFASEDVLASLLYPQMRQLGVHVLEGFPWFLTTAHSEADIARISQVFKDSLDALQGAGILSAKARAGAFSANEANISAAGDIEVPLTEAQKEVWLAAVVSDEASCAFNEGITLNLEGSLRADLLKAALNDVVARHECLRATIPPQGELLRIAPHLELDIPLIDLAGEPDAQKRFKALLEREAREPFDLAAGPLCRARLVRFAPEKNALVLTAHHVICDGWSMNIVLSELGACYAARLEGRVADLPAPLAFHRYALERGAPGAAADATEEFWLAEFKELSPTLELPCDRPRPSPKTFRGATFTDHLEGSLVAAVKKAGSARGATLFATLFAAVQVFLGKLSGESDTTLVVPMAGQTLFDDEILVGHCVDFLPVRARFEALRPFSDHLATVKAKLLSAIDHQSYTYGTLVRKLGLPRDPSRTPITDVQFNLERFGGELEFAGMRAQASSNPKAFVNFDLFLNFAERADGIRIDIDYATDLYDESTIARWIGHLKTLLAAIAADPARPIAKLPLLSAAERRWLLHDLNTSEAAYPRDALVHELIEAQAAKTPDATAVVAHGKELTYRELEARAGHIACELQRLVGAEGRRVAVALPRSVDLPAALIAIWKAGYAYVPLDPMHPPARLAETLRVAEVSALICTDADLSTLAPPGVKVLRLDRMGPASVLGPGAKAATSDSDSDRATRSAHVIFTSGSTGTPKGVEIAHRSVVNLLFSVAHKPGFDAHDSIVAVTTVSFDIAGVELFLPLITGGRCVIADRDVVRDGFALARLISNSGASVVQATPSLWRMLLEAGVSLDPGLKLFCTGEALPRDLANQLLAWGGQLWNLYGPTETTIWSSAGLVEGGDGPISIGEPVANTQIYILDGYDEPVPLGVTGEVYIGGDGLATGYFNRPDLTAAAFRPVALGDGPARRLYRTGDLGRRLADGRIQLLGRRDQQIKLRGYRIELEEIESRLRRAPGVKDAAVALDVGGGAHPRLIGYFVAAEAAPATPEELTAHLGEHLPKYMIPGRWQRLDALPMTANGKLDRKSLAAISVVHAADKQQTSEPADQSVLEVLVEQTWSDLLGVKSLRPDTDFFLAGGNSLLAMRLVTALQRALQHPIAVGALYRYPRLKDFTKVISESGGGPNANKIIRIQPNGARAPLIVLNNAWNLFPLSRSIDVDRPVISIQFVDRTVSAPQQAVTFEEVVGEALDLIRVARPSGPYVLMGHCLLGAVALEAARRLKAQGEEVTLVALLDTEPNGIFEGISLRERLANYWIFELRRLRSYIHLLLAREVNFVHVLGRYSFARRLGLLRLATGLGLKERWPTGDFHTQHIVDAWLEYPTRPYEGDVVLYRAAPNDRPGMLDYWFPWVQSWKSVIKGRFVIRDVKTAHSEIFRESAASSIGRHLSGLLGAIEGRGS